MLLALLALVPVELEGCRVKEKRRPEWGAKSASTFVYPANSAF
jgi:hypothetical protein